MYILVYLLAVIFQFSESLRLQLSMKWSFVGGGMGSMSDLGAVGQEGEYYYHPQKQAKLKGPDYVLGKQRLIALFPYNSVLLPGSMERLSVFEMKYRQLLTDVSEGSGVFGMSYYSQSIQKLALVGTLGRVKSQKMFEDGRIHALVETSERYYIEEVISERPFLKARVRLFKDYSESTKSLQSLERLVFNEIKINYKYLNMLYPENNYKLSDLLRITKNQPFSLEKDTRKVNLLGDYSEVTRSCKFSFGVIESLKLEPAVKLLLLQEHVTERRMHRIMKILEESGRVLRDELLKQGKHSQADIDKVRLEEGSVDDGTGTATANREDSLLSTGVGSKWADNYVNGEWKLRPTLYD